MADFRLKILEVSRKTTTIRTTTKVSSTGLKRGTWAKSILRRRRANSNILRTPSLPLLPPAQPALTPCKTPIKGHQVRQSSVRLGPCPDKYPVYATHFALKNSDLKQWTTASAKLAIALQLRDLDDLEAVDKVVVRLQRQQLEID